MSLKIIVTDDGSHSIAGDDGVTYHSTYGALQESKHVFIDAGLMPVFSRGAGLLQVFEMGFGTGLNALLTLVAAGEAGCRIRYETVEVAPIALGMARQLNYCERLGRPDLQAVFERLHTARWEEEVEIVPGFGLVKVKEDGAAYRPGRAADVVYYDAFDPVAQPELWTAEVFGRIFQAMRPGGVLVTYSCKGSVRRAMRAAGFSIEKLPGPAGKREILRATKTYSSLPHPSHP